MLQVWSWMLMTTVAAFVVIDWENQEGTCLCMWVITHTYMRAVTGYRGTCLWRCLNIWKCSHPSALGLILGPAPWWVIDTDGKPVWWRYRAANPCTMWHLVSWHLSNHRRESKFCNPLLFFSQRLDSKMTFGLKSVHKQNSCWDNCVGCEAVTFRTFLFVGKEYCRLPTTEQCAATQSFTTPTIWLQ